MSLPSCIELERHHREIEAAVQANLLHMRPADAAECGPDGLGTARVVAVGTQGGLEVGLKTYPRTIPLADHEVILDLRRRAGRSEYAKDPRRARGRMRARDLLRHRPQRRRSAGARPARGSGRAHGRVPHLVAPTADAPLPARRRRGGARRHPQGHDRGGEGGLWARRARAPRPKDLKLEAPFFRFPGFADTPDLREWLAANDVGIFGVDLWASDWIKMTPEEELKLVMGRLEKNGHKGMLLMHDNHPSTAAMVPMLLKRLKAEGYRVVHMTGGGSGRGPTEPAPPGWTSETERVIGALKPRLEKAAGKRLADGPIPVKPAPTE